MGEREKESGRERESEREATGLKIFTSAYSDDDLAPHQA